jgi:gluconate 2-dehydrogenase gamma chain
LVGGSRLSTRSSSRRQFLQASGSTLGAAWLATHWAQIAVAAEHAHALAAAPADHSFKVLTVAQARDVEAIAAQIVPSGDTAGAREAGVVYFVDQILAGLFAARAGEFQVGLAAFQADCTARHPGSPQFADLSPTEQLSYLKSVESTPFFSAMRFLTVLGLLSLPGYGGNANKLGWKLVGFVDQHAWLPPFGHYDRDYAGFEPYARQPQR